MTHPPTSPDVSLCATCGEPLAQHKDVCAGDRVAEARASADAATSSTSERLTASGPRLLSLAISTASTVGPPIGGDALCIGFEIETTIGLEPIKSKKFASGAEGDATTELLKSLSKGPEFKRDVPVAVPDDADDGDADDGDADDGGEGTGGDDGSAGDVKVGDRKEPLPLASASGSPPASGAAMPVAVDRKEMYTADISFATRAGPQFFNTDGLWVLEMDRDPASGLAHFEFVTKPFRCTSRSACQQSLIDIIELTNALTSYALAKQGATGGNMSRGKQTMWIPVRRFRWSLLNKPKLAVSLACFKQASSTFDPTKLCTEEYAYTVEAFTKPSLAARRVPEQPVIGSPQATLEVPIDHMLAFLDRVTQYRPCDLLGGAEGLVGQALLNVRAISGITDQQRGFLAVMAYYLMAGQKASGGLITYAKQAYKLHNRTRFGEWYTFVKDDNFHTNFDRLLLVAANGARADEAQALMDLEPDARKRALQKFVPDKRAKPQAQAADAKAIVAVKPKAPVLIDNERLIVLAIEMVKNNVRKDEWVRAVKRGRDPLTLAAKGSYKMKNRRAIFELRGMPSYPVSQWTKAVLGVMDWHNAWWQELSRGGGGATPPSGPPDNKTTIPVTQTSGQLTGASSISIAPTETVTPPVTVDVKVATGSATPTGSQS